MVAPAASSRTRIRTARPRWRVATTVPPIGLGRRAVVRLGRRRCLGARDVCGSPRRRASPYEHAIGDQVAVGVGHAQVGDVVVDVDAVALAHGDCGSLRRPVRHEELAGRGSALGHVSLRRRQRRIAGRHAVEVKLALRRSEHVVAGERCEFLRTTRPSSKRVRSDSPRARPRRGSGASPNATGISR
jgi:hypothetical protein